MRRPGSAEVRRAGLWAGPVRVRLLVTAKDASMKGLRERSLREASALACLCVSGAFRGCRESSALALSRRTVDGMGGVSCKARLHTRKEGLSEGHSKHSKHAAGRGDRAADPRCEPGIGLP